MLASSLKTDEGYSSHAPAADQVAVGAQAEALTDLRPAGKIRIDGKRVPAVSEGGYVRAGTVVEVVGWRTGTALVRELAGDDVTDRSAAG